MLFSRRVPIPLLSRRARPALMLAVVVAVGALALPPAAAEAGPNRITTGPIDTAAFQALVDGAASGTTIECEGGVYDFTAGPVLITKAVHIVAADSDDPPIFEGNFGNGFYFPPRSDELQAGSFEGLHFRYFARTIFLNGSIDFDAPGCPATGGSIKGLEIVDNQMRDVFRGVQIVTASKNVTVRDNDIEAFNTAMLILGDQLGCPNTGDPVHPGRANNLHVSGNTMTAGLGAVIVGTENAHIRDNTITGTNFTGLLWGDRSAESFPDDGPLKLGSLQDNYISAVYPLELVGPTTMKASSVQNNVFEAGDVAVTAYQGANGLKISNNTFLPTGSSVDVWLGGASAPWSVPPDTHDNKVVAGSSVTRVLDYGVDNQLIGKKIVLLNPRLAPDFAKRLERHERMMEEISKL